MSSAASTFSNAKFKIGFCQTDVFADKARSLQCARDAVGQAVSQQADLVVLGEMFSCPYATKFFREYGEQIPADGEPIPEASLTVKTVSDLARSHKIWIIGGSVPEILEDRVYNTCLVFNPSGEIVARHRKTHLFDIDVAATATRPAIKFKESDVLSPGEQLTMVDLPWCRMGIGICYDLRFPEQALAMRRRGAKLLVYPGAFNMTTGPAHWSVLARGRACDTQSYVALASPARSSNAEDYQAWGHSMLVGPWADVLVEAEHEPIVLVTEVDPAECDRIRGQVPTSFQKRADLYVPYADADGEDEHTSKRVKSDDGSK